MSPRLLSRTIFGQGIIISFQDVYNAVNVVNVLNILEASIDSPVDLQDSIQRYQDSLQYARS